MMDETRHPPPRQYHQQPQLPAIDILGDMGMRPRSEAGSVSDISMNVTGTSLPLSLASATPVEPPASTTTLRHMPALEDLPHACDPVETSGPPCNPVELMPPAQPWPAFPPAIPIPAAGPAATQTYSSPPVAPAGLAHTAFPPYAATNPWTTAAAPTPVPATATATVDASPISSQETYAVPAKNEQSTSAPWDLGLPDAHQSREATSHGARFWHTPPSARAEPKGFGTYHGIDHGKIGFVGTPIPAASGEINRMHPDQGSFVPATAPDLTPQLNFGGQYEQTAAFGPSITLPTAPAPSMAPQPAGLRKEAPVWPAFPSVPRVVPPGAEKVIPPVPSVPPISVPVVAAPSMVPTASPPPPQPPLTFPQQQSAMQPRLSTSRESLSANEKGKGRRKRDMVLEGIPAVIHPLPYKCEWPGCNDRFRRNEHLKRHMTGHTGEKPFVCWVPGCKKSFSRSDNLNVHYSTTHSKRGGRNRYVATLDETSEYYDPSYRGDLTPDGRPILDPSDISKQGSRESLNAAS